MSKMTTYFVDNKNLIAEKSSIVQGQKYRFSILSDILVRIEYSPTGVFEDRATENVINRKFDKVNYDLTESDILIQIKTIYFTLTYVKNQPFTPTNLKVLLNESNKEWTYNDKEVRNFGTISYSLDDYNGKLPIQKGLYSVDGISSLDDSKSYVINENNEFVPREQQVIDLYLFVYRREFAKCLENYFKLSGYPSMLPRYAFGNWWYKNEDYNMQDIGNTVAKFYENNIPISVFLLGTKWHDNINNYNFDPKKFPNTQILNNFMKQNKIKLGLTISPQLGINPQDSLFNQASEMINATPKGINLLPFNITTTNFYFNNYINNLVNQGVDLFSLDYNNIKDLKNLFLINHYHFTSMPVNNNKRGIILSRNSLIAPHRYPITYTGNTKVNWETLSILPYYNSSAANKGISYIANPIGGYYTGIEDDELYMRYVQFGTFSPILILASDAGKYYKREPWRWPKLTMDIITDYMQLRHRLIPYIYSESYVYHKAGVPLIQPLYYKDPKIKDEPTYKNQYYFGSQFLISPITKRKNSTMNRVVQHIYIPDGTWYHFKSGKKYPGNKYYDSFYKDEDYPAFVKEGSIIPMSLDYTIDSPTSMEIQVYPGKSSTYNLYEDDGYTNNFKNGEYLITNFEFIYEKDNYTLKIKKLEGKSTNIISKRNYRIVFRNTRKAITNVKVNGLETNVNSYFKKNNFIVEVTDVPILNSVEINCTGNDIEIEAVNLINDDIANILDDLEVETTIKEKIDEILFSELPIKKKRIEIRKLRKYKLEPKFIKLFLELLEYINQV